VAVAVAVGCESIRSREVLWCAASLYLPPSAPSSPAYNSGDSITPPPPSCPSAPPTAAVVAAAWVLARLYSLMLMALPGVRVVAEGEPGGAPRSDGLHGPAADASTGLAGPATGATGATAAISALATAAAAAAGAGVSAGAEGGSGPRERPRDAPWERRLLPRVDDAADATRR